MPGFTIIHVNSLEEAIEQVMRAPNQSPNGETEVEIRALMEVDDFGEAFTPNRDIANESSSRCQRETRAEEKRGRERIAKG